MDADERMRLFCGLRLPEAAAGALAAWAGEALHGGRVVPREHLHVTLAFLGPRPAAEVDAIAGELRAVAAAHAPPLLRPRRYRETRSAGMIVLEDAGGRAAALAGELQARLEALGVYRRESRPWLPHVTVLRFRRPPHLRPALPEVAEIVPSDAALYHSVLLSAGAQYEVLDSVALGGR